MKRLFLAATAALALAACSDTGTLVEAPEGGPRPYIVWGPTETIFTTQVPAENNDASPGWEVGTKIVVTDTILVTGYRFYKGSGETGSHTVKVWDYNTQVKLASKTFTSETASGWQSTSLNPTYILPPGTYMVSVNTNVKQVKTFAYFTNNGSISRTHVTATGGAYGQPTGAFPASNSGSAFFVDLTFRPKLCNTDIDFPCP